MSFLSLFVFVTGATNVLIGGAFFHPLAGEALGIPGTHPMMLGLIGFCLAFLGAMLMYASRDLTRFATIVHWEGLLRIAGGLFMAWHGFSGSAHAVMILGGLIDLCIGLVYVVGVPISTRRPPLDVALGRP